MAQQVFANKSWCDSLWIGSDSRRLRCRKQCDYTRRSHGGRQRHAAMTPMRHGGCWGWRLCSKDIRADKPPSSAAWTGRRCATGLFATMPKALVGCPTDFAQQIENDLVAFRMRDAQRLAVGS